MFEHRAVVGIHERIAMIFKVVRTVVLTVVFVGAQVINEGVGSPSSEDMAHLKQSVMDELEAVKNRSDVQKNSQMVELLEKWEEGFNLLMMLGELVTLERNAKVGDLEPDERDLILRFSQAEMPKRDRAKLPIEFKYDRQVLYWLEMVNGYSEKIKAIAAKIIRNSAPM